MATAVKTTLKPDTLGLAVAWSAQRTVASDTEEPNAGTVRRNANFYLKPDLIAGLDQLHITALGLPEGPLYRCPQRRRPG